MELRSAFLYNPGLVTTWFTVSGVIGTLIILNASLVSAGTMIREKERGTVEQLLMTPASALEVVAAKIAMVTGFLITLLVSSRAVVRVLDRDCPGEARSDQAVCTPFRTGPPEVSWKLHRNMAPRDGFRSVRRPPAAMLRECTSRNRPQ